MHQKKYSPNLISNVILTKTEKPLLNLKLQKLLYYAQAWHLALYESPLFDEDFIAQRNGPLLPSQFERFKKFKGDHIFLMPAKKIVLPKPKKLFDHIRDVLGAYENLSSFDLAQISHAEPPWLEARQGLSPEDLSTNIISKESLKRYFQTQIRIKKKR